MPNQTVSENGEDTVVREDTAKAFRWNRFVVVILGGFIVLLIVVMLFFSGIFKAAQPNLNPSNSANQNRNPGP